jgi:hypothetical protein
MRAVASPFFLSHSGPSMTDRPRRPQGPPPSAVEGNAKGPPSAQAVLSVKPPKEPRQPPPTNLKGNAAAAAAPSSKPRPVSAAPSLTTFQRYERPSARSVVAFDPRFQPPQGQPPPHALAAASAARAKLGPVSGATGQPPPKQPQLKPTASAPPSAKPRAQPAAPTRSKSPAWLVKEAAAEKGPGTAFARDRDLDTRGFALFDAGKCVWIWSVGGAAGQPV